MSSIEQLALLRRHAREMQANLMVRVPDAPGGGVTAVLNPGRLALMRAVLADPNGAKSAQPHWLASHLLAPVVELHTTGPVGQIDGTLRHVTLRDAGGHRYPLLYGTHDVAGDATENVTDDAASPRVSAHRSHVYRLHFVGPLAWETDEQLLQLELQLADTDEAGKGWTARWAVSRRNLQALDRLPLMFGLARLRGLHLARRLVLLGQLLAARAVVDRVARCAPELRPAHQLKAALRRPVSPLTPLAAGHRLERSETEDGGQAFQVGLRAALLARLWAAVQGGLLAAGTMDRAATALRRATAKRAGAGPDETVTAALVQFDALFARMLGKAVTPLGPLHTPPARMRWQRGLADLPWPEDAVVQAELASRVDRAARGLVPRWVDAVQANGTRLTAIERAELRPVLRAKAPTPLHHGGQVVAELGMRLGSGWWHPGLPDVQGYTVRFVDRADLFWAAEVARASSGQLPQVARRILERELGSADLEAAQRAVVDARQPKRPVADADHRKAVRSRAAAVRAVAPEQPVELRREGARWLARSAKTSQRKLLARLAGDADDVVRVSAQIALARMGDTQALLALGSAARGGCEARGLALPVVCGALDTASRTRLLHDALHSGCHAGVAARAWALVARYHPDDETLLRDGLGHRHRSVRIHAAVTALK